jgi:mRNA interferase RelE/StbE
MIYQVIIDRPAAKAIKSLDRAIAERIRNQLRKLALNPYDSRITGKVRMSEDERKSRVGDWRILFRVDKTNQVVKVTAVKPRRRAYPKQ